MAHTPSAGTSKPTSLPTGLRLDPLDNARFAPGYLFAGRYRIVSLLGRGAMGEVYRADDLRLGQPVALKIMAEAKANRDDRLERFTAEVRLARTIVHPNVCRVFDIGHAEGWHYLSMEYVDGETLASLLRRIGELPPTKALDIARQLCGGVAAAHDRGVLHRDLKPSNIMVDGRGQIRIMDFGLAITADADVREVAGTPGYMAPEQVVGGPVTTKTDLYALGRLLTEILPNTDPQIASVVHACLAPDPAGRPESAHAVLTALPAVRGGRIVLTPAMVAALPRAGVLSIGTAWLLLGAVVAGTVLVASQAGVFNVTPAQVPKPPEVLAERARDLLAQHGHMPRALDRAYWWSAADGDTGIQFTYRESSGFLIPTNMFRVVTTSDPPFPAEGMRMLTLDADGTPRSDHPTPRAPFSSGRSPRGETLLWIGVLIGFVAGAILAHRNLRAGEGDRRGAWRLSAIVVVGGVVGAALKAHHVPLLTEELAWLLVIVGWAGVWGIFAWLAYVTFEAYTRRWRPDTLVSWARLLAGQLDDPLVGRDLLIGMIVAVVGTSLLLLLRLGGAVVVPPAMFRQPALEALQSSPAFAGTVVLTFLNGMQFALSTVAALVLLRLLLRRTWLAVVAQLTFAVPLFTAGNSALETVVAGILVGLGQLLLLRVGVLAFVTMFIVSQLLTWLPLTLDGDAWYFGRSLVVLALIAAVATYAFMVALGEKPAFGDTRKSPVAFT